MSSWATARRQRASVGTGEALDCYSLHAATIYDRPAERIPVYIAGGGPATTKYAGRVGEGHICTSGKGDA